MNKNIIYIQADMEVCNLIEIDNGTLNVYNIKGSMKDIFNKCLEIINKHILSEYETNSDKVKVIVETISFGVPLAEYLKIASDKNKKFICLSSYI